MQYRNICQNVKENMDKINLNNTQIKLTSNYNQSLLNKIEWSYKHFNSHNDVAKELKNKNPYTVTVLIEDLKWKLGRRKEYVKFTKVPISTLYHELLFKKFYQEFGDIEANKIYARWLKKYDLIWKKLGFNSIDDLILTNEIEPQYKKEIMLKHKNHRKLEQSRYKYKRERYYNLPKPFNFVDWRTPL